MTTKVIKGYCVLILQTGFFLNHKIIRLQIKITDIAKHYKKIINNKTTNSPFTDEFGTNRTLNNLQHFFSTSNINWCTGNLIYHFLKFLTTIIMFENCLEIKI